MASQIKQFNRWIQMKNSSKIHLLHMDILFNQEHHCDLHCILVQKLKMRFVLKNYVWNGETKRLCNRDSLEWMKLGCYYFCFLFILGVLFCALVIVYILLLDKKTPRRYGNESAMAFDGGINPGRFN